MDAPDLTGAEVYVAPNSIARGRWYVLPADAEGVERVIYERADDQCEHPETDTWVLTVVLSASLLRTSPTWTRLVEEGPKLSEVRWIGSGSEEGRGASRA